MKFVVNLFRIGEVPQHAAIVEVAFINGSKLILQMMQNGVKVLLGSTGVRLSLQLEFTFFLNGWEFLMADPRLKTLI